MVGHAHTISQLSQKPESNERDDKREWSTERWDPARLITKMKANHALKTTISMPASKYWLCIFCVYGAEHWPSLFFFHKYWSTFSPTTLLCTQSFPNVMAENVLSTYVIALYTVQVVRCGAQLGMCWYMQNRSGERWCTWHNKNTSSRKPECMHAHVPGSMGMHTCKSINKTCWLVNNVTF